MFYTFIHILGIFMYLCLYCLLLPSTATRNFVVIAITWLLLKHFRNVYLWHRSTEEEKKCHHRVVNQNGMHGKCYSCNWLYKYCWHSLKTMQAKRKKRAHIYFRFLLASEGGTQETFMWIALLFTIICIELNILILKIFAVWA